MAVKQRSDPMLLVQQCQDKASALLGLANAGRFDAFRKLINTMCNDLRVIRESDPPLVTELLSDLVDWKEREDLSPEDHQIYANVVTENLAQLAKNIRQTRQPPATPFVREVYSTERTYGRMMSKEEFREMERTNLLQSRVEGQLIPTFESPQRIQDFFLNVIKRDKARSLQRAIGGRGDPEVIVIFTTRFKPTVRLPSIHLAQVWEAKFVSGTPIQLIAHRRI